jgi:hypothetical protein
MLASGVLALAVAGGGVAAAGAASAHPFPVPKAAGSVALAHPAQYVSFNVQAGPGRHHGWIDYANFMYRAPFAHTNVWNILGNSHHGKHALVFTVGSSTYAHTMYVTSVTPTSTTATSFSGTGFFNDDPVGYAWTVKGTVTEDQVSFTITYTGKADPGYILTATGAIAAKDGSVSGTATDNRGNTLKFTMPAGSAFQVLRFQAAVNWVAIGRYDATFGFTVPRMPVRLAGLHMIAKVHDGGPGFHHDTYAQGIAFWGHFGKVIQFPITSGNIFVHR